ncbi:MAG TPA: alpha/beta hydrolase [Acidimicrobiales bacterium]|nr:alpha/beta hydrolase [Acidimicrobiales bacterium]
MPIDPQIKVLLDQLAGMESVDYSQMTPEGLRQMIKMIAAADGPPEAVASVEEAHADGPAGPIPLRVYRPATAGSGGAAPAILVWYHGGGWVVGDLETADTTCRKLANRTDALVVSVDYRLAPEHPAPAPLEDSWAALRWVADQAATLGGDPSRLAVGGDSAGGNLSALVAVRARDDGAPTLRQQLLVYPATDLTRSYPSHVENGDGYLLTSEAMSWFLGHYLGPADDPKDPALSPLYTDDLTGVAGASVFTAELDPLRDEGEAYAARLRDSGVAVDLRRYDGMVHGFLQMAGVTPVADAAVSDAASRLRAALD